MNAVEGRKRVHVVVVGVAAFALLVVHLVAFHLGFRLAAPIAVAAVIGAVLALKLVGLAALHARSRRSR